MLSYARLQIIISLQGLNKITKDIIQKSTLKAFSPAFFWFYLTFYNITLPLVKKMGKNRKILGKSFCCI